MRDFGNKWIWALVWIWVALLCLGWGLDALFRVKLNFDYRWVSPEERLNQELQRERDWAVRRGIPYPPIEKQIRQRVSDLDWLEDLEDAEPNSSVFQEYMEEIEQKGIEPGSPEAMEIWETYYK